MQFYAGELRIVRMLAMSHIFYVSPYLLSLCYE